MIFFGNVCEKKQSVSITTTIKKQFYFAKILRNQHDEQKKINAKESYSYKR